MEMRSCPPCDIKKEKKSPGGAETQQYILTFYRNACWLLLTNESCFLWQHTLRICLCYFIVDNENTSLQLTIWSRQTSLQRRSSCREEGGAAGGVSSLQNPLSLNLRMLWGSSALSCLFQQKKAAQQNKPELFRDPDALEKSSQVSSKLKRWEPVRASGRCATAQKTLTSASASLQFAWCGKQPWSSCLEFLFDTTTKQMHTGESTKKTIIYQATSRMTSTTDIQVSPFVFCYRNQFWPTPVIFFN